ncbi:sugar ABC transporter ATP-binding protein [Catenulispora rubra]|uniref:sugar ABC transporter ATP-binding protein n=1 Tax=Catenulispora rubra TaxID=280293 RepID=UPI00189244D4|nr:sugar ABC transporter ATP-binding protein [Catenulispora rubra]
MAVDDSSTDPARRPLPALSLRHVSKSFAGQRALADVSFDVPRGEITALLGMNGSGKSTLIKILAGVYEPDPGGILHVAGEPVTLPMRPAQAHAHGLRFLHQDVGLVGALSIADNFALAERFRTRGPFMAIDRRAQNRHVARALAFFGIDRDAASLVSALDPTTRTMVGVARAFQDQDDSAQSAEASFRKNILVLDEPTASLPAEEVGTVLRTLERLRAAGGTVIYVSHRTDEVRRIADRLLVLRDGRLVADQESQGLSSAAIVSLVIGRTFTPEARAERPQVQADRDAALTADGLSGRRLRDVGLQVRAGEILGVAGLVGCGRSELIRILAGAEQPTAGRMTVDGKPYAPEAPADALARGVSCVPQNRHVDGCVLPMTVRENLSLGRLRSFVTGAGTLRADAEHADAARLIADYSVKPADSARPIATLSGGNQQKVVVARAASRRGRVLLLDEPTQGVDALAKQEIATSIRALASGGTAVLLASSDFQELAALCDRVLVLDRGAQVALVEGDDISEERLTLLSTRAHAPAHLKEPT